MSQKYLGSCLCDSVQFSVTGFSKDVANCHCSMCRKFHGSAFGTLVGVTGLIWLTGQNFLNEYKAPNGTVRTFCSNCGSSIGFRVANASQNEIELAIASFNSDIPVTVDAQIYTSYKANWCKLTEGVQVFREGREK